MHYGKTFTSPKDHINSYTRIRPFGLLLLREKFKAALLRWVVQANEIHCRVI